MKKRTTKVRDPATTSRPQNRRPQTDVVVDFGPLDPPLKPGDVAVLHPAHEQFLNFLVDAALKSWEEDLRAGRISREPPPDPKPAPPKAPYEVITVDEAMKRYGSTREEIMARFDEASRERERRRREESASARRRRLTITEFTRGGVVHRVQDVTSGGEVAPHADAVMTRLYSVATETRIARALFWLTGHAWDQVRARTPDATDEQRENAVADFYLSRIESHVDGIMRRGPYEWFTHGYGMETAVVDAIVAPLGPVR